MRSNGSIIGPKRTVSASSAPGIWAIRDAQREKGANNWGAIPPTAIDFLLIAGGGGCSLGGGGAGGYREFTGTSVTTGTEYTITVGAGGAGTGNINSYYPGKGVNSSAFGQSATGGGKGQGIYAAGEAGGSGGGAGSSNGGQVYAAGGSGNEGGYSPVEGYNGANNTYSEAGGGGGAGSAGFPTIGGAGRASSITGTSVTRARGGYVNNSQGASGANTGNGGSYNGSIFAADGVNSGGSGVVIIAYPSAFLPATATTGSPTYSSVSRSGYHVYTFTASGSITF